MFEKDYHDGVTKAAAALGHAVEIAGLGTLAAPSVQELRGKPFD